MTNEYFLPEVSAKLAILLLTRGATYTRDFTITVAYCSY